MKITLITLLLGTVSFSLFSQELNDRKVVTTISVDVNQYENAKMEGAVYPGCYGEPEGNMVSTCNINMVTKDLNEIIQKLSTTPDCSTQPTTLNLSVDKTGVISLEGAEGENLTQSQIDMLKTAVSQLNSLSRANGQKIIPARANGLPIGAKYSMPYLIKGQDYHLYETFQVNDQVYKVFRNCNHFYIKEGDSLQTIDIADSEEALAEFKSQLLNQTSDQTTEKSSMQVTQSQ